MTTSRSGWAAAGASFGTTLRCYRQATNSYLVPHLGEHRLSQVDAMTMDIYAHTLPAMDRDAARRFDAAVHGPTS